MSNQQGTTTQEPIDHSIEIGHGNSPAAWTCVTIMLVGVIVGCIAFMIGESATVLFIVGVAIIVVGLIAGPLMRKAGYGVGGSKLKNTGH